MSQGRETLSIGSVMNGSRRDHYRIETVLGRGGFSTIYLVRDVRASQNQYALKEVLNPNKRDLEQLTFEYEILTHIEHSALPRVYRVFKDDTSHHIYILMEYIEGLNGEKLRKRYPESRMPLPVVLRIMTPIMEAVSFLHQQEPPVLHRDIKPSNIIVSPSGETAYLVDFGTAKRYASEATTTALRHFTPGYGAPEQYAMGTTPSTDIYGLGATFYTLLTGQIPVEALERMMQYSEDAKDPLVPIQELVPTIPNDIAEAIHRAMSLRRTERFATVDEFRQALHPESMSQDVDDSKLFALTHRTDESQSDASKLSDVPEPEKYPALAMAETVHTAAPKKRSIAFALLSFMLLCVIGIGGFLYLPRLKNAQSPVVVGTSIVQQKTPLHPLTPTSHTVTASPQSTLPYAPLVTQYTGTISDIMNNSSTTMSLTALQQQKNTFHGNFVGLGLAGTFAGTLDTAGHMQFQVSIHGGNETLIFEGAVKVGGSIAGSYRILNRNHEFTGEYGLWSVSPVGA